MSHNDLPLLPLVLDRVPYGLRQALAQEGIPFVERDDQQRQGRFILFDSQTSRNRPPDDISSVAIDVASLRIRGGTDRFAALTELHCSQSEWHIDNLVLTEQIAQLDRRAIRHELLGELRHLIEAAGGVWLRVSPYPFPYRTAFNFRIDYDQYDPHDFDTTMQSLVGYEHASSHFVNGAAYATADDVWSRFRCLDVGSHGYWHHTYRTESENIRNIRRGVELLHEKGIEASGFVAPGGRFNGSLLSALTMLGIGHSSEFSLSYDDLPFEPMLGGPLQIPIHPICLGLFLEASLQDGAKRESSPLPSVVKRSDMLERGDATERVDAAIGHFDRVIRHAYDQREPIFLYGHPTGRLGRYPEVMKNIFRSVAQRHDVWKTTLSQWADWWRVRSRVQLSVRRQGEQLLVQTKSRPSRYPLALEYYRDDCVASIPLELDEMLVSPDRFSFMQQPAQETHVVSAIPCRRTARPRALVKRMIDWEKETPWQEIERTNWQNVVKRTLRQWQS